MAILNDRYVDEYKTENTHINVAKKNFNHYLGNITELIVEVCENCGNHGNLSTYKIGLPLSTKIFNFNQFVSTLDLDVFYQILKCYHVNVMGHLILTNIVNIL